MVTTTASAALKRRVTIVCSAMHDLARDRHRVARVVRHRGMAAAALDDDLQHVGRGQQRARRGCRSSPCGALGMMCSAKAASGSGSSSPSSSMKRAPWIAFLARLEHEAHFAGSSSARAGEHARGAGEHRGVRVVAAGVHPPGDGRGERQARSPPCIGSASMSPRSSTLRPALPALSTATAPVHDGALAPFERQVGELGADLGQGLGRFEPELGLGMDGAAQRGDAVGDAAGVLRAGLRSA